MTLPSWVHVADVDGLAERLIVEVRSVALDAVERRGVWALAIPGGSVLERLMPALARAALPWDRAHVFWCDERMVPRDDPQSNWQALRALGETVAQLSTASLHPMPVSGDMIQGIERYEQVLRRVAGNPPVLDVALLGVGEDGHVASLFPGQAAMEQEGASVVSEEASPKPPPRRLSLSLPLLANASLTAVAAFGVSKQAAVRAALDPQSGLPVARVLRRARRPLLLADAEAASLIG